VFRDESRKQRNLPTLVVADSVAAAHSIHGALRLKPIHSLRSQHSQFSGIYAIAFCYMRHFTGAKGLLIQYSTL
jgi:hypothetical protein